MFCLEKEEEVKEELQVDEESITKKEELSVQEEEEENEMMCGGEGVYKGRRSSSRGRVLCAGRGGGMAVC